MMMYGKVIDIHIHTKRDTIMWLFHENNHVMMDSTIHDGLSLLFYFKKRKENILS